MSLRSADRLLMPAVARTLEHLELEEVDYAAARLAVQYAQAIDDLEGEQRQRLIGTIGPSLLKCLESLGATPRARAEIGKKVNATGQQSPLDKLRAARR